MPISSFNLKDISAIKHVRCENIPDLMLIAGPNGVGKSTLLDTIVSILQGNRIANSNVVNTDNTKPVHLSPHRAPAVQRLHKSIPHTTEDAKFRTVLSRGSHSFNSPVGDSNNFLRGGTNRSRNFPDFAPYFEVKNKLARYETKFTAALSDIYKQKNEIPLGTMPDIFEPIKSLVSYLLPGVVFEKVELNDEYYDVMFRNKLGVKIEFDALSSGEKDVLAMLFSLVELQVDNLLATAKGETSPNENLVILIDSPESHLHPSLQEIFLKYIRDSIDKAKEKGESLQFILTTHSPIMINAVKPTELFLMTYPNGDSNQIIRTDDFDLSELQKYLGRLGLSALTFGKPILLLEGKDDSDIIHILLPELAKEFVLYHVGGKEHVSGFIETFDKLIDDLSSRRIHIFGILDKDRENIVRSKSESLQKSLFTLPVVCMENLLLDSNYIFKALETVAGNEKLQSMRILNQSDIVKLKETIISKNLFLNEELRIRLNEELSMYVNIDDVTKMEYLKVKEKIDSIVETRSNKIKSIIEKQNTELTEYITNKSYSFLNGKIILNHIAQKFGLEKNILARAIAKEMKNASFVPSELNTIISKIQ